MKPSIIPNNIIETESDLLPDFNLINYQNDSDITKNKIFLTQNVFSFLIEGTKEIFYGKKPLRISENKFAIITASNCLMSEKKSTLTNNYNSILLTFSNQALLDFKLKYKDAIQESKEVKNILVIDYNSYILNFRTSLKYIIADTSIVSLELIKVKFEEIMLYLLKTYPKETNSLFTINKSNLELEFRKVIENNLTSNLDVEEFAFLCNQSLSTFKRYFKKYYVITPKQFFIQERMKIALSLLRSGKLSSEIYSSLGYKTLSNFIKAYKNHYGKTPKNHIQNLNF